MIRTLVLDVGVPAAVAVAWLAYVLSTRTLRSRVVVVELTPLHRALIRISRQLTTTYGSVMGPAIRDACLVAEVFNASMARAIKTAEASATEALHAAGFDDFHATYDVEPLL